MSSDEPREVSTLKKKTLYLITYILLALVVLILLTSLFWGRTLRLAKANRLFNSTTTPDGVAKARRIYEDLLVKLPHSPYLLHNLGLAEYRAGQAEEAADRLQSAQEELEKQTLSPNKRQILTQKFRYHQGSAWFTAAEAEQSNEEALTKYQKALEAFRDAIKADPTDLDAKYNYELTLLRLNQEKNQDQREEGENQEDKEESTNEGTNKEDNTQEDQNQDTAENEENEETSASESDAETQAENEGQRSGMSKEEAAALLEMAESGALYQGPILPNESTSNKDW